MALTVATFAANLLAMSVTGITRTYSNPPQQLNAVDLPVLYPRVPESSNGAITFGSQAGLDTVRIELVAVVQPYFVDTNAANFTTAKTVIDNLVAALKAEAIANNQIDSWEIRNETTEEYWAVVATVEGSG